MNESEFENELRALRPRAPSSALESSLRQQLVPNAAPRPRAGTVAHSNGAALRSILSRLGWALGGAAAALAAFIAISPPRQIAVPVDSEQSGESKVAQETFMPTESSRELIAAEDGGVVYDAQQAPTKRLRYSSVERHSWANPVTGARIDVEVPREDVVLVPVSFQ